jgi:hypothetical protein
MKNYKVSEARARFGDLLDEAEGGDPVVIERRGVRFLLAAEQPAAAPAAGSPLFTFVDPAVMSGQWSWAASVRGLRFRTRRPRR